MVKFSSYGEIMIRNTVTNKNLLTQSDEILQSIGGSELNVMVGLSNLGYDTSVISAISDDVLGQKVITHLKKYDVEHKFTFKTNNRLGQYYLEVGDGFRPSRVTYDRKYSAFSQYTLCESEIRNALGGVSNFHISGITLAISNTCVNNSLLILKYCKENNIKVSMDFNYRAKLWSIEDAKEVYLKVLPYIDVLFASLFDLQTFIDCNDFEEVIQKYDLDYVLNTKRDNISAHKNGLKAYGYEKNKSYETDKVEFDILDRIGGGDAFVVGALSKIVNNKSLEEIVETGFVCGLYKHSVNGDALIINKNELDVLVKNKGQMIVNR